MTKTIDELLNSYQPKTAEAPSLPDNHPATGLEDATDVPTGQLIPDATAPLIEEFGKLNPDSPGSNTNDKDKDGTVSIGTETGPAESGLAPVSELKANIKDPGPDSNHPASTDKNDKYASFTDIGEIAKGMADDFNVLLGLLREPVESKQAAGPTGSPGVPGAAGNPEIISQMHPEQQKIANALVTLTQGDAQTVQDYSNMVRAHLAPFVEVGIRRATKLANFIAKHAEDPMAAAAELGMGGDPAAAGADPMAGADPAAAGGDPSGGMGGGDPAQEAMMVLQQIADQSGLPIEQVIEELEDMIEGEGGGGEGGEMGGAPAGDAGMPPPIPAEEIPMGGEGGGEAAPPPEEGKTAAAPGKGKQAGISKEAAAARAMLGEVLRKSGVR